jgi:type IV secretion system protein VirD4
MELMWSLLGVCGIGFIFNGFKLFGKQNTKLIDEKKAKNYKNLEGTDGIQISTNIQLTEQYSYEGINIIAPTGTGKTTAVVLPNLLQNKLPRSSEVVIDLKGEIYKITAAYQKNVCGRKVIIFNPLNPSSSLKYNPLEMCLDNNGNVDITQVRKLAQSVVINGSAALNDNFSGGNNTWENMSIPLTTVAMLHVMQFPHMNNISEALNLIINNTFDELNNLFSNSSNKEIKKQWKLFKSVEGANAAMGSIKITLATSLQIFTDPKLEKTTSHTDFNFKDFRKTPTIIYVQYSQQDAKYLSPFLAVFYTQMFEKLLVNFNDDMLGVFLFLDEFNNSGKIIGFDNICATARSSKMCIMPILQDLQGLFKNYGEGCGATILNNLKTTIVMDSLKDLKALNLISVLCGDIPTINKSVSTNSKGEKSTSISSQNMSIATPAAIRKIGENDVLIMMANKDARIDKKNTYFLQERYKKNVY